MSRVSACSSATAAATSPVPWTCRGSSSTRARCRTSSTPKTHEGTFRRVCFKAGLNPYLLEMVNLRNQDSWVHKEDRDAATFKALDMVKMGVEKAALLVPLETSKQPMIQSALVIGGGPAGMIAAANLAGQGYETHLVEREEELGGLLRQL